MKTLQVDMSRVKVAGGTATIDTAHITLSDGNGYYETAVKHDSVRGTRFVNTGHGSNSYRWVIVAQYADRMLALAGHRHWVETIRETGIPQTDMFGEVAE